MTGSVNVVRGLVIPSKWDEDGSVTAVVIASNNEIEYQVEDSSKHLDLMNYLHQLIEIDCVVTETMAGRPVIRVLEFRKIDKVPNSGRDAPGRPGPKKRGKTKKRTR